MSGWALAGVALLVGGLGPAVLLATRGDAVDRVVGLQLTGSVSVLLLLVISQAAGQSSWLIVPLVLVLLAFAGTLVFTRLLRTTP